MNNSSKILVTKPLSGNLLFGIAVVGALFLNVANAFLLLLGWVLYASLQEKHNETALGTPALLMLVLAGWITSAQFWSGIGAVGWFTTWIFLAIPLAFFGWQGYAKNQPASWQFTQTLLGLLGCFLAVWGIAQVTVLGQTRAMGPLADPNTYGCLLNLLWFPLFARFITAQQNRTVLLCGFALFVIHLALMMSGSRAASLIWLLLCTILIVSQWHSITKKRLAFICAMAAVNYLVYSIFSSHLLFSSYGDAFDVRYSESPRLLMWLSTIHMWLDAPWLGSGLGSWNYLYPMYRIPDETGTAGYYAHNDYLQLLQEGGVFTLLIFVGVLGWLGASSIRKLVRLPSGAERIENAGIVAGIAAATLHAFVNFTFYLIYINILVGIYLGKLFQSQGRQIQEQTAALHSQLAGLKNIAIFALITVTGFHALLSSAGLALLRDESPAGRFVHFIAPRLDRLSAAALLASIRPSDTTAQRYFTASLENEVSKNPFIMPWQAGEMFTEVVDGYELLRKQNQYDATTPANEAGFLIAYDKRFGTDLSHLQRARKLLQESLRMDPSRADSAILLAETFFIEGLPQQAFDSLNAMAPNAWHERDRMMIEAEILKHRLPEHAKQLAELQQGLREMRVHCGVWKCGEHYAQLEKSARQTLNSLESGQAVR